MGMGKHPTYVEKGLGVPFIHVSQNPNFANGRHVAHLARVARHPKTIGFEDIVEDALYVVEENARYSSVPGTHPYVQKSLEGHPIWMSRAQLRTLTQSCVLEMDTPYPKV